MRYILELDLRRLIELRSGRQGRRRHQQQTGSYEEQQDGWRRHLPRGAVWGGQSEHELSIAVFHVWSLGDEGGCGQ